MFSSMEKNFSDQAFDSDIKLYEEIRKLTTEQGEDYTTGCLLHYEYIKNHYRLIAVGLSRQKNQVQIQKQFQKQNLLDNEKMQMVQMLMELNLYLF